MYPAELTDPMRAELKQAGLTELTSKDEVDTAVAKGGSVLLLVNSVCGCAAAGARPGVGLALANSPAKPDQAVSVFAGVDPEATAAARGHFPEFPPSSPSIFLLVDGEPVWAMHRHQIEGRHPEDISSGITAALQEYCKA